MYYQHIRKVHLCIFCVFELFEMYGVGLGVDVSLSEVRFFKIRFLPICITYECLAGTNCRYYFDPLFWARGNPIRQKLGLFRKKVAFTKKKISTILFQVLKK